MNRVAWGVLIKKESPRNPLPEGVLKLLNHERAVLRSKTDAVAERHTHVGLARGVGDIIEITVGIGLVQVDGWRNLSRFHCAKRCAQAGGATGALWMTDLRFGSGHWDSMRVA